MRTASKLNRELGDLWTVGDLCNALKITPMTVAAWRRERDLPTVILPGSLRNAIRFIPEEIEGWAARRNLRINGRVARLQMQAA